MSRNTPNESAEPATGRSEPASTGVSTTPTRLDADAAQSAAGTLPQAIDVNAIDDCTVEGRTHTSMSPLASAAGRMDCVAATSPSPSTGNSANVVASTAS